MSVVDILSLHGEQNSIHRQYTDETAEVLTQEACHMSSGSMYRAHLPRLLAVPVLAAGLFGGSVLDDTATARADDDEHGPIFGDEPNFGSSNETSSIPNEYANPASTQIPWDPWISDGMATVPQVDIPGL